MCGEAVRLDHHTPPDETLSAGATQGHNEAQTLSWYGCESDANGNLVPQSSPAATRVTQHTQSLPMVT